MSSSTRVKTTLIKTQFYFAIKNQFVTFEVVALNLKTVKAIFLILLMSVSVGAFSQEPLTFSEAIEVSGINKDELFIRGREWFNENFKSSKDVLQIADKESGELVGRGAMEVNYLYKYWIPVGFKKVPKERNILTDVSFQMNIWVKDGKFKYEMTNLLIPGNQETLAFGLITTSDETQTSYPNVDAKK